MKSIPGCFLDQATDDTMRHAEYALAILGIKDEKHMSKIVNEDTADSGITSSELKSAIEREIAQKPKGCATSGDFDPCIASADDFKAALARGFFTDFDGLLTTLDRAIFFAQESKKAIEEQSIIQSEADNLYYQASGTQRPPFKLLEIINRKRNLEAFRSEIQLSPTTYKKLCRGDSSMGRHEVNPDLMDIRAAAKYLGYTIKQMYNLTSSKSIPFLKPHGKIYFYRQDLDDFIKRGRQKANYELEEEATKTLANKTKRTRSKR